MNTADLKVLQVPITVFVVVAACVAGGIYYSDVLKRQSRQQLLVQDKQLKEARTRLQKSGEEKEVIVRYLGGYQQLQRAGFAGDEQRINWLDALRQANLENDLFGVNYNIGKQAPFPYASDYNPGQVSLNESTMKMQFRLLHEEDLMRFFDTLARENAGVFIIDQCFLERLNTGGVIRFQPNLKAECEVSWVTARPAATPEKKP